MTKVKAIPERTTACWLFSSASLPKFLKKVRMADPAFWASPSMFALTTDQSVRELRTWRGPWQRMIRIQARSLSGTPDEDGRSTYIGNRNM